MGYSNMVAFKTVTLSFKNESNNHVLSHTTPCSHLWSCTLPRSQCHPTPFSCGPLPVWGHPLIRIFSYDYITISSMLTFQIRDDQHLRHLITTLTGLYFTAVTLHKFEPHCSVQSLSDVLKTRCKLRYQMAILCH